MQLKIRGRALDVAWTLADRFATWRDPEDGVRRLRSRAMMAAAGVPGAGGYDSGRRERRATKRWRPPSASADADTLTDLPDLRGRSRDLARNAPIATGAIATTITNVVGDGLQLQASIDREALGLTEDQADKWERAAEREWRHFCETADFTRVQPFNELQALAFGSVLESGDVFIARRFRKDAGDLYGTKLQVFEADRVSNPDFGADSDTIAGGVEVDGDGVPVAYHVTNKHPGGLRPAGLKWTKIAARTDAGKQAILHLYDRKRPELSRGVPYLAPVVEHLKQIANYSDAEVAAAVVSASFTAFIISDADQSETPVAGEKETGGNLADNELKLGNGAILGLDPGEKVEFAEPQRPNAQFDPFVQAFLRQVGVALELPYEILIKHFTASYSASRAALEMAWQFFRRRRAWLARRMCQVVYGWVIEEAVALGRLSAPGFLADPIIAQAYCGALWIGPNRASIDPLKEATADAMDIENNLKTREQVCMERTGGEFEKKIAQLAKEASLISAAGLALPVPGKAAAAAAATPPGNGGSDLETQPNKRGTAQ